jgi:hypothetical protein
MIGVLALMKSVAVGVVTLENLQSPNFWQQFITAYRTGKRVLEQGLSFDESLPVIQQEPQEVPAYTGEDIPF